MEKQRADEIITNYLQKIYGFAIKKSYSYQEAEELCSDIIQEVYLSLLKADEIINLDGYIWRISEHTYAKFISSKKKLEGISIEGMEIPFYDTFSFEDSEEELYRLRREIAYLTKKRRTIVYLFYYENKEISYISQKLGIPEGTVKWHLNKARIELKESFFMERKIGKLGIAPISATFYGHDGCTGNNEGPEFYLGDKLNLNIVYSVYFEPKTQNEIAEELGVTPVFIEDRIHNLENNGFLTRISHNRFTTYVCFNPNSYSRELWDNELKLKQEAAKILAKEYVPIVRSAIADWTNVYLPTGNRELLEASAIFYGIANQVDLHMKKDLSKYMIKTMAGGTFIATLDIPYTITDPDYQPSLVHSNYWSCGSMTRGSLKYPSVHSWSIDSRLCSRQGNWKNNYTCDYEYLYEFITGNLPNIPANEEKYNRLKEREFISADQQVNLVILKGNHNDFYRSIPSLPASITKGFADMALEIATMNAKYYPPQMQDLVITRTFNNFIGNEVAIMVMDILYEEGIFKKLTDREKITSQLLMFSDTLPQ